MIYADTGFWVGLLSADDALHPRCQAWAKRVTGPIVTSEYVMVETLNRLASSRMRSAATRLFHEIRTRPGYQYLAASPERLLAGTTLYEARPDKTWSLTDCISFEIMSYTGITDALAYDRHFEQAGFRALLRSD